MKRRIVRSLGTLLIVAGVGLFAYAGVVWKWQDPATGLYTRWQQKRLADDYDRVVASFREEAARPVAVDTTDWAAQIRTDAKRYRVDSDRGAPIGRLKIPRLGVDMLLVNGTDGGTLKKGPGRYAGTPEDLDAGDTKPPRAFMPGEGELVYVAGHRTTYQAPFSRIDRLRVGDTVTLELPYANFVYRITGHRIVDADKLTVLRSRGVEQLALQACHPRFFASHRYIVYATPVRVTPRGSERALTPQTLAASG